MGRKVLVLSTSRRGITLEIHFATKVPANPVGGTLLNSFGSVGAEKHVAGKANGVG
jgi:hypothetical protein